MKIRKSLAVIPCMILILSLLGTTIAEAGDAGSNYVLVYDRLYAYGEKTSQVLDLYTNLKSAGNSVLLLQKDSMQNEAIDDTTKVIVMKSSFDTEDQYKETLQDYRSNDPGPYPASSAKNGLMIGIKGVYPFSDLNRLMDFAEILNRKGIRFVCDIMPVYENYDMKAFGHYLEALNYVDQMGGEFFIHYPVINNTDTYDKDTRAGLTKAVAEYRKRGIDITGIVIPSDALFQDARSFQRLGLHFLIIEASGKKVDAETDLMKVSKELDRYVFIKGIDADQFNDLSDSTRQDIKQTDLLWLPLLNGDTEKTESLLTGLRYAKIPVKDFEREAFLDQDAIDDGITDESGTEDTDQTELEKFKEEELKKIKGENMKPEQASEKEFDISKAGAISIKIAAVILLLLAVQIYIGKRYDSRKFFKK